MITVLVIVSILFVLAIIKIKKQDKVISSLEEEIKLKLEDYTKLVSQKKSSEISLGLITEQLAPFMDDFPFNPRRCHFLGQPIDYVVFEDDRIVFCEVKMNTSKMSVWQRNIKRIVDEKKVEWYSYNLKPKRKIDG